mmetsp:Transcript_23118/g.58594  ORF Transcript_23118/g.58594 Transcript_23118/m.58594 type:complete len:290 (-) Transcript_23118:282-1151(-)
MVGRVDESETAEEKIYPFPKPLPYYDFLETELLHLKTEEDDPLWWLADKVIKDARNVLGTCVFTEEQLEERRAYRDEMKDKIERQKIEKGELPPPGKDAFLFYLEKEMEAERLRKEEERRRSKVRASKEGKGNDKGSSSSSKHTQEEEEVEAEKERKREEREKRQIELKLREMAMVYNDVKNEEWKSLKEWRESHRRKFGFTSEADDESEREQRERRERMEANRNSSVVEKCENKEEGGKDGDSGMKGREGSEKEDGRAKGTNGPHGEGVGTVVDEDEAGLEALLDLDI